MIVLRIALLSMTEPAVAGQPYPRAALRVAGASLARHQLGLALALKCHRVIVLARDVSPDILALQHVAQDAGMQFYIASGPRQVAAQVGPNDDFILVADGLFVDPAMAVPLLEEGGNCVLVQPVEGAQGAGFERIDLNNSAAGLARVPGTLVARLNEVPEESDIVSILTRIALQSRADMREVPPGYRAGAAWRLVRSEAEAIEVETQWLQEQFTPEGMRSPGRVIAQYGALVLGGPLLQMGHASNIVSAAVLGLLALAALLGWFGLSVPGFVLAGLAWILVESGRRLRAAERRPLGELLPAIERADVLAWAVDLTLIWLVLMSAERLPGQGIVSWLFAPVTLVLVLAMAPRTLDGRVCAWLGDRTLLALVLAAGAAFGEVLPVVQVGALAVLLAQVFVAKRSGV